MGVQSVIRNCEQFGWFDDEEPITKRFLVTKEPGRSGCFISVLSLVSIKITDDIGGLLSLVS